VRWLQLIIAKILVDGGLSALQLVLRLEQCAELV
jgi:hypothetical protein